MAGPNMNQGKEKNKLIPSGKLGTFAGVFTPSILTILGIILFLRLGFVVGNAGLGMALLIILLANTISVLTTFSLSAIATNLQVKGGGDYYLISRTLGIEFGGALGLVLFLAQAVSIGFYCVGFGEVMVGILPPVDWLSPQIIAALAIIFLFFFAWLGADWATRFQYVVMAVLVLALFSFFVGGLLHWNPGTLTANWSSTLGWPLFWPLFAIFFPAVTGFTQGVSMSGDLEDPGTSLPKGTFLAVGLSILVYFGAAVVFAASVPTRTLRLDYGAMGSVALFSPLVSAGVVAATLSSAMASFLGAPRILQSLAKDRIFKLLNPFAKGEGATNNPRRGVCLSLGIALGVAALGNLNLIAGVVSMFFLISYGLLNYATYYEARAASPSFRPRFRFFDQRLSLAGAIICLITMLAIDWKAGAVAVAVMFALYQYLRRTAGPSRWADSRRSYHLQQVRQNLYAIAAEPEHPRDWRPQILAISENPAKRLNLLRFAAWMEGGSGLTTLVQFLVGENGQMHKQKSEAEKTLVQAIGESGHTVFPLVLIASSSEAAFELLLQSYGVGPLKGNTLLMNHAGSAEEKILGPESLRTGRSILAAYRLGFNFVLLKAGKEEWASLDATLPGERRIDIWCNGEACTGFLLLMAYLVKRDPFWEQAKIRVLASSGGKSAEETEEHLKQMLTDVRIEAEPCVVPKFTPEILLENSQDASMVFMPFRPRGANILNPFGRPVDELLKGLPVTALILATKDIDLGVEPEEGAAAELAMAGDAFEFARKELKGREDEAAQSGEIWEEKFQQLLRAQMAEKPADEILALEMESTEARKKTIAVAREVARAEEKVEITSRYLKKIQAKYGITSAPEPKSESGWPTQEAEAEAEKSPSNGNGPEDLTE
jgi:amino acid transporter